MITLEKYKGRSTRYTCPNCGAKHAFSRYIDESGNYLSETVGKCDRASKCAFHYTPKQFFADNPRTFDQPRTIKPRAIAKPPEVKKPDFIAFEILRESLDNYDQNSFVQFLLNLFPECHAEVWAAVKNYLLGTEGQKVVFWQIDAQRRIRTGKIMLYSETGKRIPETFQNRDGETVELKTNWIHAQLKRRKILSEDFNLKQCFFGEHLTAKDSRPIAIVEAEKTAVIASLCFPEFVWIASGGKQNLNAEKLARFRDKQIILYPDGDGFEIWQKIAQESRGFGVPVKVSSLIEKQATAEQKAEGFDLADLFIDEARNINAYNAAADRYNSAVDSILQSDELQAEFNEILDEQKSILIIDGGLDEQTAESLIRQPDNLRRAAMFCEV